jgi:hypothetical protein
LQCIENKRDIVDIIETTRLEKTLYLLVDHNNLLPNFRPEIIEKKEISDACNSMEIVQSVSGAQARSSVTDGSSGEEEELADGSSDSGLKFNDSDYDVEDGDDDLFSDNVDTDIMDNNEPIIDAQLEDDVALEDTSLVLRHEDEEQLHRTLGVFNPLVDMEDHVFKEGLVFNSVQDLRLAINAYSVKNRVRVNKRRKNTRRLLPPAPPHAIPRSSLVARCRNFFAIGGARVSKFRNGDYGKVKPLADPLSLSFHFYTWTPLSE